MEKPTTDRGPPLSGTALACGANQGNRSEDDFYRTPADVTYSLLAFLNLPALTIWEPACGEGHMARPLEEAGHRVISTDLIDRGHGQGGINFLTAPVIACDAIITNPPFVIAEEFISRAIETAPIVAMLLKSQYWHAQCRYSLYMKTPPSWVLPLTWRPDFLGKGSPTMDCIWTVWLRGDHGKRYEPLPRVNDLSPRLF